MPRPPSLRADRPRWFGCVLLLNLAFLLLTIGLAAWEPEADEPTPRGAATDAQSTAPAVTGTASPRDEDTAPANRSSRPTQSAPLVPQATTPPNTTTPSTPPSRPVTAPATPSPTPVASATPTPRTTPQPSSAPPQDRREPTSQAAFLLSIEPALPPPHEPHPARREGFAAWVYAWPSSWNTDWSESYRHQPPLPRPIPDPAWPHATARFKPAGLGDRPFILVDGEPVTTLTDAQRLGILTLVRRHQLLLGRYFNAFATGNVDELADTATGSFRRSVVATLREMREVGAVREQAPHTHEIGAIAYYPGRDPGRDRAVTYEVYRNATWLSRDRNTGAILDPDDPASVEAPGLVAFTLTWWSRQDLLWVATDWTWVLTPDAGLADAFVLEYFDVLDPYHQLWIAAFAMEEAAR